MSVARHADLVVLALALPVFALAGFSMLGYVTAAVAWLVQRGLQVLLARRAERSSDLRTKLGLTTGSALGRGWMVALVILLVGLRDNDAGLAAAVLTIVLFTIWFSLELMFRPLEQRGARR